MDSFQLAQDVGRLLVDLIPFLVVAATVTAIWWAIARSSREKAEREQRIELPYPTISSGPTHSRTSSVDPYPTTERPADPTRNEPPMSGSPAGYLPAPARPAPPAQKRPAAKVALIAVAALVVVLGAAGAIAAASTGSTTRATDTAATIAATGTATTSPSAVSSPTVSPTPAPTTAAPSPTFATVAAWYRGGGKALLDAMHADTAAIRNAAKNKDEDALRDACTKVLSDAMAAKSFAPIPDDQAQPHWAKSLPLIVQGALDCADAIDGTGGNALLAEAVREMNEGDTEANLVVARLNALLG